MEVAILMIILAVGCLLCGPIALICAIVALNRTKELSLRREPRREVVLSEYMPITAKEELNVEKAAEAAEKVWVKEEIFERKAEEKPVISWAKETEKEEESQEAGTLEQQIGTRWLLIIGVITVIFGVGFFLKYAYDNGLIGPMGRVIIAAVGGLICLCIGEVTRKRGYGIAAKGVTALGFAILYAAVFSAYRFYGLIGSVPTFVLAILVTVAAMLYAVSLDEILIAVLSLVGGFLTPVLVSTGENLPKPLFSYVLILGTGAMLCAYFRKWRAVNIIAFAGTYILYTGWFEKFFRSQLGIAEKVPPQMAIALGWLTVFFAIYLILPLFNGFVKKARAQREDILLVLSNAAITFYYLWTILYDKYRIELAFCATGLCAAHLVVMGIATKRCREDIYLRLGLLVTGLFFLTIAVPLYLKMYAVSMAWAAEGVVLAVIGLRYRSIWTQLCAGAAFVLSLGQLLNHLPMHTAAFTLGMNPALGAWVFAAAALVICHILYRRGFNVEKIYGDVIAGLLYAAAVLVLMAGVVMEWYWHCEYNITENYLRNSQLITGMILIFTIFALLPIVRPVCPQGIICKVLGTIIGGAGSIYTMIAFTESYRNSFMIFVNSNFGIAMLFVAGLFAGAWALKESIEEENEKIFCYIFAIGGIVVLWVLLSEQIYLYWYCRNKYVGDAVNWRFLSNMYISVMWAIYGAVLMAAGFWRKVGLLRYISLGLFALLLGKVFVFDMSTVKSVYRIAAFLATGVTLVSVSYLYQFLKKKGFFDAVLAEKETDK